MPNVSLYSYFLFRVESDFDLFKDLAGELFEKGVSTYLRQEREDGNASVSVSGFIVSQAYSLNKKICRTVLIQCNPHASFSKVNLYVQKYFSTLNTKPALVTALSASDFSWRGLLQKYGLDLLFSKCRITKNADEVKTAFDAGEGFCCNGFERLAAGNNLLKGLKPADRRRSVREQSKSVQVFRLLRDALACGQCPSVDVSSYCLRYSDILEGAGLLLGALQDSKVCDYLDHLAVEHGQAEACVMLRDAGWKGPLPL